MARKIKSVYERIEETKLEITSTEQTLAQLKSQLVELETERDDLEMRQTWQAIKENGLGIDDIKKFLDKQAKAAAKTA